MTPKKKDNGPPTNYRGSKVTEKEKSLERKRIQFMLIKIKDLDLKEAKFKECDPSDLKKKLELWLKMDVQPPLREDAMRAILLDEDYHIVVGVFDKSRQSIINKIGDFEGAGNASMDLYWDIAREAVKLMSAINGNQGVGAYIARVGPSSDEGVLVIGGMKLSEDTATQFAEAWDVAASKFNLRDYTYPLKATHGGLEKEYELNLEAFGEVLKYRDMIATCDFKISQPTFFRPTRRKNIIMEMVRQIENEEVRDIYDLLPENIRGNGGLIEVKTSFKTNLTDSGIEKREEGSIVEIRFSYPDNVETGPMLDLTKDVRDEKDLKRKGTKKGFAEIFRRIVGMRWFNTFLGKARTNRILTAVTKAMRDLEKKGIQITPVTRGYLQYWLKTPPGEEVSDMVQKAITRRMEKMMNGPLQKMKRVVKKLCGTLKPEDNPIGLEYTPVVSCIAAKDNEISKVRQRFILDSLGKDDPAEALDHADFLVNFIEHIREDVREDIFKQMALEENGAVPITQKDRDMIELIEQVCVRRNAIRDTEDFIWTLREDSELPFSDETRASLEDFIWAFSNERYENMFYLLAERIAEEAKKIAERVE
jgi:hypothetical protein